MTSGGTSRSIAARLDTQDNALNLLRLVLAGLVVVSHAWPLGGFGGDPHLGDLKLGTFAVGGFFAISGFLICGSRLHLGFMPFLWRRFLRIVPALLACLVVVGFGLAAVVGAWRGGWSFDEAAWFVLTKATLQESHQTVGSTLSELPFPDAWNGPLWTIRYEVACYLLAGVVGGLTIVRARPWITVAAFVVATVASAAAVTFDIDGDRAPAKAALLLPFFLAGAVLLQYRERLPLAARGATVAAGVLAAGMAGGVGQVVAPLPLAYLLLWLAAALPQYLRQIGSSNDLSYGVYLYGWPVQQVLVLVGAPTFGVIGYTSACLIVVVPFAAASWWWVEKPIMRHKGALDRRPTSTPMAVGLDRVLSPKKSDH